MKMRMFLMALVACLIATTTALARPCPRPCAVEKDLAPLTHDALAVCRDRFERGVALHEEGKFSEAAVVFERAHALPACKDFPEFVFNSGMAHFRLCRNFCLVEECVKARNAFMFYLAQKPDDAQARTYLANAQSVAAICSPPRSAPLAVPPPPPIVRAQPGPVGPTGPQGPAGPQGPPGLTVVDDTLAQAAADRAAIQAGAAHASRREAQKSADSAASAAAIAVEAARHRLVLSFGPLVGATGLTNGTNVASSIGGGLTLELKGEHAYLYGDAVVGSCGSLSLAGAVGVGYQWEGGFRLGVAGIGETCLDVLGQNEETTTSRLFGGGLNIGFRASSGFFISALLGAGGESHPIPGGRTTEAVGLGQLNIGWMFDLN